MLLKKNYGINILTICIVVYVTIHITSCSIIAFAPYKRTEEQLKSGDSVVLVSISARRLHLMEMAYVTEGSYKYTQQMLPAFKSSLTESGILFANGYSQLETTGDLLYEALRQLRRKKRDTMLLTLLKKNIQPYNIPVLLVMNAATPPNPYRSSGGFYGGSYVKEKDKGNMQIRSFVVLYQNDKIIYFDAIKSGGRYRAITQKRKKAVKISKQLVKKLVKTT